MKEQRRLAAIVSVNFSTKSVVGHSRRFRDVRDMSELLPTADVLRARSALRIWARRRTFRRVPPVPNR